MTGKVLPFVHRPAPPDPPPASLTPDEYDEWRREQRRIIDRGFAAVREAHVAVLIGLADQPPSPHDPRARRWRATQERLQAALKERMAELTAIRAKVLGE